MKKLVTLGFIAITFQHAMAQIASKIPIQIVLMVLAVMLQQAIKVI